jgi:hypothetical protein
MTVELALISLKARLSGTLKSTSAIAVISEVYIADIKRYALKERRFERAR